MYFGRVVIWLVFSLPWTCGYSGDRDSTHDDNRIRETAPISVEPAETCNLEDFTCLSMVANDKLGLEAIKSLHQKLDDDANGNVDLSESDDFLREELKYDSGYEKRQKAFHRNDDMHISVKELWEAWVRSEVHNWTVEQTSEWLAACVELPQYVPHFIQNKVTGANLPRLAVNNVHYLNTLGIKDPIHRQKIALKAMDVVLFGPPKDGQPHWKDLTLIALLVIGTVGMWYAVQQNKKFKNHLNRMTKDMDSLQNAEKALENLQKELEQAKQAQENVASEKENLEKRLQETHGDSTGLHNSYSDLEVSQLKAEIEMLRAELQIAEGELKDRCWSAPLGLQQWLQLTYEIENKAYIKKKMLAEKQLQQAREACEKLRKKRSSLVGAFVSTHGKSIDDVDRSIVEARTSLNEVTQELQERVHRWKQIELLCGFNIVNNSGLQFLENTLYRGLNGRGLRGRMSSTDDLDDETSSLYMSHTGLTDSGPQSLAWKEADSSGSEGSKHEEDVISSDGRQGQVTFSVGDNDDVVPKNGHYSSPPPPTSRSISNMNITGNVNPNKPMLRSFSQDIQMNPALEMASGKPKTSHSETSLDNPLKPKVVKQRTIKEQPSISIEEDVCSTDSSVIDEEIKKKKRKLFGFSKKSKIKD